MTAALDESFKWLQDLCELLRDTNPALESGAAELDRLGHSLGDSESHLSLELDHLATDLDGLQKEAETSEAAAVKACEEMAHACEEVKAPALADLEKDAAATQAHWIQALQEKATALDTDFGAMTSAGWEPLETVLASEKADFEKWTQAADAALDGLVHIFTTVGTEVEHDGSEAEAAAHELKDTPPATDAFWQQIETEGHQVTNETSQHFGDAMAQQSANLATVHEELVAAAGDGSTHVRAQLDLTLQQATDKVDAQSVEMRQALEKTVEALDRAQTEFQRSNLQAEKTGAEVHDLVELAGQVETAKGQLAVIHEVTEALGQ